MDKIANIPYMGVGSQLTAAQFNILQDKTQSGIDSIFTGSCVISGTTTKVLSPAGTGSPTTWGRFIEAGSGATSAGSVLWVVFGTSFTIIPMVTATSHNTPTPVSFSGSPITAGSVRIVSSVASSNFSWVAVG